MLLNRLWNASIHTRIFLRRWMPTNRLLDWRRRRENLKWGVLAMLLGAGYLFAAAICTTLIEQAWSEWPYLVFALALWNGLKLLLFGPWSLILLAHARRREARIRRQNRIRQPQAVRELYPKEACLVCLGRQQQI